MAAVLFPFVLLTAFDLCGLAFVTEQGLLNWPGIVGHFQFGRKWAWLCAQWFWLAAAAGWLFSRVDGAAAEIAPGPPRWSGNLIETEPSGRNRA